MSPCECTRTQPCVTRRLNIKRPNKCRRDCVRCLIMPLIRRFYKIFPWGRANIASKTALVITLVVARRDADTAAYCLFTSVADSTATAQRLWNGCGTETNLRLHLQFSRGRVNGRIQTAVTLTFATLNLNITRRLPAIIASEHGTTEFTSGFGIVQLLANSARLYYASRAVSVNNKRQNGVTTTR